MKLKTFKRVDDANMEELAAAGVARAKAARELNKQELEQVSGGAKIALARHANLAYPIEWLGQWPDVYDVNFNVIDRGAIKNVSPQFNR